MNKGTSTVVVDVRCDSTQWRSDFATLVSFARLAAGGGALLRLQGAPSSGPDKSSARGIGAASEADDGPARAPRAAPWRMTIATP